VTGLEAANAVMDTLHGEGKGACVRSCVRVCVCKKPATHVLVVSSGLNSPKHLTTHEYKTGPARASIIPVEADEPHVAAGRRLSKVLRTLKRNLLPFYDFPLR
jgi:hypothetical protein